MAKAKKKSYVVSLSSLKIVHHSFIDQRETVDSKPNPNLGKEQTLNYLYNERALKSYGFSETSASISPYTIDDSGERVRCADVGIVYVPAKDSVNTMNALISGNIEGATLLNTEE